MLAPASSRKTAGSGIFGRKASPVGIIWWTGTPIRISRFSAPASKVSCMGRRALSACAPIIVSKRREMLKTLLRWVLRCGLGLVGLLVLLLITRWVLQERIRVAQAIQSPPGIDSMEEIEVGGIKQWIHIRGRDRRNPILLYLHGGPGTPMMPFAYKFQAYLEGAFTVVEWDQRGSGKTYFANDPAQVTPTINYERMQSDALEMVN